MWVGGVGYSSGWWWDDGGEAGFWQRQDISLSHHHYKHTTIPIRITSIHSHVTAPTYSPSTNLASRQGHRAIARTISFAVLFLTETWPSGPLGCLSYGVHCPAAPFTTCPWADSSPLHACIFTGEALPLLVSGLGQRKQNQARRALSPTDCGRRVVVCQYTALRPSQPRASSPPRPVQYAQDLQHKTSGLGMVAAAAPAATTTAFEARSPRCFFQTGRRSGGWLYLSRASRRRCLATSGKRLYLVVQPLRRLMVLPVVVVPGVLTSPLPSREGGRRGRERCSLLPQCRSSTKAVVVLSS